MSNLDEILTTLYIQAKVHAEMEAEETRKFRGKSVSLAKIEVINELESLIDKTANYIALSPKPKSISLYKALKDRIGKL